MADISIIKPAGESGTAYNIKDTSAREQLDSLADVASSGDYNDLTNTPTSLPANGGNANTVSGFSGSAFLRNYPIFAFDQTNAKDVDSVTSSGVYSGNNWENAPLSNEGTLLVIRYFDNDEDFTGRAAAFGTQIFITASRTMPKLYYRFMYTTDGTQEFSAWGECALKTDQTNFLGNGTGYTYPYVLGENLNTVKTEYHKFVINSTNYPAEAHAHGFLDVSYYSGVGFASSGGKPIIRQIYCDWSNFDQYIRFYIENSDTWSAWKKVYNSNNLTKSDITALGIPDTNTTYSAGTGLSLSGTTINHSNSVTAGTIGSSSATSGTNTISIPYATYDTQGHITGKGTHTHTISSATTSSVGLMAAADKVKVNALPVEFAVSKISTTATTTATPTSTISDFNSATTPGFYTMRSVTTNAPTSGSYHSLIVMKSDTEDYLQQVAFREGTTEMYVRYCDGDDWSSWQTYFNSGNCPIESAAMTTPAKAYAKLANGLCFQWGRIQLSEGSSTVSFKYAFSAIPAITYSSTSNTARIDIYPDTTGSFSVQTDRSLNLVWVAIGTI